MDIVNRIPYELANFGAVAGGSYNLQDNQFDYALGGIPFLSATRDAWPHTDGMAEIRKQQFDSFAEPGEQSLQGWWLRSQSTFTGGAGILYQDPDNDNQFNLRFADSLGVDPWTSGDVKLLRRSSNVVTTAVGVTQLVRGYVSSLGVDSFWHVDGNLLNSIDDVGSTAVVAAGAVIYSITSTGTRYIIAKSDGLYFGNGVAAPVQRYTWGANVNVVTEWVKARNVVGVGPSLYTAPDHAGVVAIGTAPSTLFYTHPNPDWIWTSLTEGPTAIYAAGHDGTTGAIFKFTLEAAGAVPVLTGGIVTAQMPNGERINSIYGYIGSFVGIATTKGFRVGEIDAQGDIQYGPLLFTPTGGCKGITGFDRFMWTGSTNAHDGASGLFRVDLGSVIQEQTTRAVRYAYARDIYMEGFTGAVTSVSMFGGSDRKVYAVAGVGCAKEQATELLVSGFLDTGRIRFNTEEPKLYKFFSIRTPTPLQGEVTVSVKDEGGGITNYITYGPSFSPGTGDISTPTPAGPQNWIALRFLLERGANTAFGGVLNGWQVKALPGSIRQRIITHTWLLFDKETDKGGQNIGYDGYARTRLEDFKQLARKGDIVTFQELEDQLLTLVVIDDWRLTQLAPPGPNGESLGGYLTVIMRTVAETA